jgi:hypothetical protein
MLPRIFLLVGVCLAQPAVANDIATGGGEVVLGEAIAHERAIEGHLNACELTYLVGFADHIYRKGDIVILRGAVSMSAAVTAPDKPPFITFKVTAFDVVGGTPQFTPLHYGYLSANGQSYAGKEYVKFPCDDGGLCMGYSLIENVDLAMAISDGFEINVNRSKGGSDVRVPVHILRDRPQTSRAFNQCTLKLMDVVQKKFGG